MTIRAAEALHSTAHHIKQHVPQASRQDVKQLAHKHPTHTHVHMQRDFCLWHWQL